MTITASDASGVVVQGSTQTFTVTLAILPPCTLSTPSPTTLGFTLAQGQASSTALAVALSESLRSKVLDLMHQRELGWMFLDDKPAKRKPLYTSRKFCDEYVERRMQAARGVVP